MRRTCLFGLLGGLTAGVMLTGCLEDPRQGVGKGSSRSGSAATGEPTTASRSGSLGEQGEPVFDQGPVGVAVPEFGSVAASSILPSTLAPLAAGQAEDPPEDDGYIPVDDPFSRADAEVRDRYDRALMDALALMADRRFEDALAGFRAAQQIRDTREVRRQIGRVQILVAREAAAQSTLADIEAVLDGGRAEEASALAAKALEEFGDSTLAPRFAEVKRRSDAISGARLNTDAERRERFRNEGEAALRDRNFRAAILAFEQVLAYGDDARVRENLDELRQDLAAYDDNVRRASELRRDPWSLEDAVSALELARRAWDTEQVRLDLDELKLAIDNRRDRVAIADFETIGQTGVAGAGRLVADELVPHIRGRFDVLDRARLAEVMGDLQLASADLTDIERNGAEVAKAAKFRYLIHGSVRRMSGLVVHARMVDVRSGLVVQTARASARSGDDLLRVIPQLAADLISTDQEHLARAQSDSESAVAPAQAEPVPFEDNATGIPLPPPPPPPEAGEPAPAPIQFETPKPPPDGGLRAEDFNRLPPPPAPDEAAPPPPPAMADEGPVKAKFFDVLIGLADNLFSRGDIQGAMQQYLIADQLFPGNDGVQARLDRCRPLLPPPDPGIVIPVQRPRLAMMHFVVRGNPRVVPPGLSAWTPDLLAPYYSQQFDIVDRNRVSWWMYRTGITQRQLLTDPGARRWLGRAMGARWFLLGTVDQTNSFNVGVHLIDAEFGWVRGSSFAHCRDVWDLKLAAGELARRTLFTHDQRRGWMLNRDEYNREIEQGRQFTANRRWREASDAFARAQAIRPDSEEARELKRHADSMIFTDSRRGGWDRDWDDRRRDDDDSKRRRWDLARKAEQSRIRTAEDSRPVDWTRDPAGEAAYRQLMTQGRSAMTQRRFDQAIRNYESALGFRNTDEAHNALAEAKARLNEDLRLRQADEDSRRIADHQRMRDESLAKAKAEFDRKRRERDEERARLAELQRAGDRKRYDHLLAEAERFDELGRFGDALNALQAAKALGVGDPEELDRKVRRIQFHKARNDDSSGRDFRAAAEKRRLEFERRREAEESAKRRQDDYHTHLTAARNFLTLHKPDDALVEFREAEKLFRTDAVLDGIRQAQTQSDHRRKLEDAESRRRTDELAKQDRLRTLLADGDSALAAGRSKEARDAYVAAAALFPDNVQAIAGISKADRAIEDARRRGDWQSRMARFRNLLQSARDDQNSRKYDSAIGSVREALTLSPNSREAKDLLTELEGQRDKALGDATKRNDWMRRRSLYDAAMTDSRLALSAKDYDMAIKHSQTALTHFPGDRAAQARLDEATAARDAAAAAAKADIDARKQRFFRAERVRQSLQRGRTALAAGDLKKASDEFDAARELNPTDPQVLAALGELSKARDAARIEEKARGKRSADHAALMATARRAMNEGRFDDAAKAASDAARLMPDDKPTEVLLHQALEAAEKARRTADLEKTKRERFQRAAQVRDLLNKADAAEKARRFDEAAGFLADAQKLAPQDPDVISAVRDLETTRTRALGEAEKKKRLNDYGNHIKAAQAAMTARRYDDAAREFQAAQRLFPGDKVSANGLKDAESRMELARLEAEQDAARRKDSKKKFDDLARHLKDGDTALAAARFADAEAAYREALRVAPGDLKATSGLRSAAIGRHLADGRVHLTAKRWDQAIKEFDDALKLAPNSVEAKNLLGQAQLGRKGEQDAAKSLDDKRKAFANFLSTGRAAMNGKRYGDAVVAFRSASELFPSDPEAKRLLGQAETARDADAVESTKEKKRLDDYKQHMTAGNAAMTAGRFADAVREFGAAQQLYPNDRSSDKLLRDAQNALDAEKAKAKTKTGGYLPTMTAADAAVTAGNFEEAIRLYRAALALRPNDPAAEAGLRRARFGKFFAEGQRLHAAGQWDAAQDEYRSALQLFPNSQKVTDALDQLRRDRAKGKTDTKPKGSGEEAKVDKTSKPDDAKRLADYQQQVLAARKAVQERRWDDAVKAYEAAQALFPGDRISAAELKTAQAERQKLIDYRKFLVDGKAAMDAKRYDDAVKAYEAAQALYPGDKVSADLLKAAEEARDEAKSKSKPKKPKKK